MRFAKVRKWLAAPPRPTWQGAALPLLALGTALLALGLGWRLGWLEATSGREAGGWRLLYVLLVAGLVNVALLALLLGLRDALTRRQRLREQWQRELRHLAPWATEEGILRKVGLIRDLNALDAAPATLEQAVLAGADLRGCNLRGCNLRGANLSRSDLQGAALEGANLWDADLSGANLSMAGLQGASLRGCNLEGATLAKANLGGANLNRANLVNANLHGARLQGASLTRARFALRQPGGLEEALHASVEDWIRARLDARGYYIPPSQPGTSAAEE